MKNLPSSQLLWLGLAMLGGASLPLMGSSGCGGSRCSPSTSNIGDPSSSVECPGGTICYQGQCVATCNAGSERADPCEEDGDCSGGRPFCSNGFCSACEPPTACIPQLDICSALVPRPPDQIGGVDGGPGRTTQSPLDSGPIDPPTPARFDSGVEIGPVAIPLSHTATVTLRAVRERGGTAVPEVSAVVEAIQTGVVAARRVCIPDPDADAGAGADAGTQASCEEYAIGAGSCALYRKLRWATPPDQGDLGKLSLRDPQVNVPGGGVIPNGVTETIELTFDRNLGIYRRTLPTTQTLPANLLIYTTNRVSEIEFEGSGSPITQGESFPIRGLGDLPKHRMPLELCDFGRTEAEGCYGTLTQPTMEMMRQAQVVGNRTLEFGFTVPTYPSFNPNDLMKTEVIVDGARHEIRCVANRDSEALIRVPVRMLQRFRVAENLAENNPQATVDLYFQRVNRSRLEVRPNPDLDPPTRTDLRLELSYVWKTKLSF